MAMTARQKHRRRAGGMYIGPGAIALGAGLVSPTQGVGASPVFDTVPAAYALYGLERLVSTYSGPAVRLRRASDNAEQDFTPNNGNRLSRSAIVAWAGTGVQVRVKTWYDQSGNARDATMTTDETQQPILDLSSSVPTVFFVNSAIHHMNLPSAAYGRNQAALAMVAVASAEGAIAGVSYTIAGGPCGSVDALLDMRLQNSAAPKFASFARRVNSGSFGLPTSAVNGDDTGFRSLITEGDFANNVSAISVDGTRTTGTTDTAGNTQDADAYSVPAIGASRSNGAQPFSGHIRCVAFFQAAFSAGQRTALNAALDYVKTGSAPADIAAWGDSLTAAAGYPEMLAALFQGHRVTYNGGVGGETAAQIRARQVADNVYNQRINLLWAGRNSFKTQTPAQIIADIDLMIAHVIGGRYLVTSIPPSTLDSGAENTTRLALNAALAAAYGSRYFDIIPYWNAANDGSANDLADIAAGLTPRSTRADELHPNDIGKAAIAAGWKAEILARSWGAS